MRDVPTPHSLRKEVPTPQSLTKKPKVGSSSKSKRRNESHL